MFLGKIAGVIASVTMVASLFNPFSSTVRKQLDRQSITEKEAVVVTEDEAREKLSEINSVQREHLPSIVCWGDSLTYGSGGDGTTYPKTLEKLIKENITDKFDLKKIMNASDDSDVDWDGLTQSRVSVINMGIGGERSDTICGRAGVIPFTVKGFTLPAGKEKVPVEFEVKGGQQVAPLLQGDGGVNPVHIGDVKGMLSYEYVNDDGEVQYYFTPSREAEEVTFADGTEMICSAADKYKNSVMVIMMGGNGGFNTPDELFAQYDIMLTRQETNADRFIIVGYHGTLGALNKYPEIEDMFKERYGEHYVSLADYFFSEQPLIDAGIEITDEIRAEFESGKCPTAFLADSIHFNAVGYELVGKLIYERMDALGYFDELKEAYGLR